MGSVGGENTNILNKFLSLGERKGNVTALRKGEKENQEKSAIVRVPRKYKTYEKQ